MLPLHNEKNCNAQELLAAVQVILDLGQWNTMMRLLASDDPEKFIADVHKHASMLEEVNTGKGKWVLVFSSWEKGNLIPAVKAFRTIFGTVLADAKGAVERIFSSPKVFPVSGTVFDSEQHAYESETAREAKLGTFVVQAVRANRAAALYPTAVVWKGGVGTPISKFQFDA